MYDGKYYNKTCESIHAQVYMAIQLFNVVCKQFLHLWYGDCKIIYLLNMLELHEITYMKCSAQRLIVK